MENDFTHFYNITNVISNCRLTIEVVVDVVVYDMEFSTPVLD